MVDEKSKIDVASRLSKGQARKVLAEIFNTDHNFISFSKHGLSQMNKRSLKTGDVLNVLKGGQIQVDPEFENGSYRYRVTTSKVTVVIAFRRHNHVVVVTAWRN